MLEIAGDIAAAAAAFAGLILVFFGASISSFDSYDETARDAVRGIYRRRAWPGLAALLAALLSCYTSLSAKALMSECAAYWAAGLLALVGILIFVLALLAVWEIG